MRNAKLSIIGALSVKPAEANKLDDYAGLSEKERQCAKYWKGAKAESDVVHSRFNVAHYRRVLEARDRNSRKTLSNEGNKH